jgi:tRNA splicing ligase
VNKEGDVVCAEFLDEEMGEKVIVAREVEHVHNFGRTPFCAWLFLVTNGGR